GQDRYGMDIAFIEHAEHYVNCNQRSKYEQRFIGERRLKCQRRPLKTSLNRGRHPKVALGGVDGLHGIAQSGSRSQIERQGDGRELALMVDGKRSSRRLEMRKGIERHLRTVCRPHVDVLQSIRVSLEARIDFDYDVILVQLREDG